MEAETRRVHELVEATSAEAKSVRGEVESRVATLAAAADTSATRAVTKIAGQVEKVAAYSDARRRALLQKSHSDWNRKLERLRLAPPRLPTS